MCVGDFLQKQKVAFKIGTGSGTMEYEKSLDEVKKFVGGMNKKYAAKLKSFQAKDLKGNPKQISAWMKGL